jgi:carboxypeptidase PM20D1
MVQDLAAAIRFQTVSSDDADETIRGEAELTKLLAFLRKRFALVFDTLKVDVFGAGRCAVLKLPEFSAFANYSLLIECSVLLEWKGSDDSLKPSLLMAHMDVVPAPADLWTHPPFEGVIADGFVWGRGALDDKVCVVCGDVGIADAH